MIAAVSNGGGYANIFRQLERTGTGLKLLDSVLDEVWDFDTRISRAGNPLAPAPQDYLDEDGKPLRGYYQSEAVNPAAFFKAILPDRRWANYYDATLGGTTPPPEVPPLPPRPVNDTGTPDGLHSLEYTHHLIRDFMFLDAAAHNNTSITHPVPSGLQAQENPYLVVRKTVFFTTPAEQTKVSQFTRGPGRHPLEKFLLNDSTLVEQGPELVDFERRQVAFTALLYELQERNSPGVAANVVPNWFGVAVPDNITDLQNVILYFHPNPTQAQYDPAQYQTKSGTPNWKELFAYVDRLGNQLAGAATSAELANQIVIVPFMREYRKVGILPTHWYYIVRDILEDIRTNGV